MECKVPLPSWSFHDRSEFTGLQSGGQDRKLKHPTEPILFVLCWLYLKHLPSFFQRIFSTPNNERFQDAWTSSRLPKGCFLTLVSILQPCGNLGFCLALARDRK